MDRRSLLKYTTYLTGYALAAPLTSAILSGCQAEAPAEGATYTPRAVSTAEFAAIIAIADTMLPATNTPSASELGVPAFVDLLLAEYTGPEDMERIYPPFKAWLATIAKAEGMPYMDLSTERQLALLNTLDQESIAVAEAIKDRDDIPDDDKDDYDPWWIKMKSMMIGGYYSSELIGTEVLAYSPVPGPYQGCIPLEEATGGKAWSLG